MRKLNPLLGQGLIPKGAQAYDADQIVALYSEVRNLSEMERRTGIGRATIRRYLAEQGVQRLRIKCTPERCKQISDLRRGCVLTEEHKQKIGAAQKGEKHWNWQGGITKFWKQLRNSGSYKVWRKAVLAHDNYTCQECGCRGEIEAHHLVSFALILRENKIKTMRQAQRCKRLWDVGNGQSLCHGCHENTPSYRLGDVA